MMLKLYCRIQAALASDRGATAVEYGVMVALIAAVIVITVGLLGDKLVAVFDGVRLALP